MPDWQERMTHETPPQIRLEHVVRYAAAIPLLASGSPWCDLGCGTGLAAAEAFGDTQPSRALLVDLTQEIADEAAGRFASAERTALGLDLSTEEGVGVVGRQLLELDGACITCFELIEHLDGFVPLVRLLIERAAAGATVLLSVPNDSFFAPANPYHRTAWGEGSFDELLRLLPDDHIAIEQVALVGSALRRPDGPVTFGVEIGVEAVEAPTHLLAAFGARANEAAAPVRVEAAAADARRLWERQREWDLAYYQAQARALEAPGPPATP